MGRALDGQAHSPLQPRSTRRAVDDGRAACSTDDPERPASTRACSSASTRAGRAPHAVRRGDRRRRRARCACSRPATASCSTGRLGPLGRRAFDDRARWRHAVGRARRRAGASRCRRRAACSRSRTAIRDVVLRGTESLAADAARARRRLPARRHPRASRRRSIDAYRDSGLSHLLAVSGENVAFVLALFGAAAPAAPARRAHGGRARDRARVRGDDAVRAVGAARVGDGGDRAARVASAAGPRRACACSRYAVIVLLARRSVPVALGRVRLSCGASAGIALVLAGRSARACPARASSASRSRSRSPRSSAYCRCCSWLFGTVSARHAARQPRRRARGRGARRLRLLRVAPSPVSCRGSARCCSNRPALLVAWITAVAARAGRRRPACTLDTPRRALGARLGRWPAACASVACLRARRRRSRPSGWVSARSTCAARVVVMGILNRTPDSFYDRGATWDFDAFLRRAEQLVADGADLLDVGGVKAGPGPEVGEAEELDRVVPAIEALQRALRRAALGRHVARVGARRRVRARARSSATTSPASTIPTTSRSRPSTTPPSSRPTSGCGRASPIPIRTTTISSPTSPRSCSSARERAEAAGLAPEQIVLDAGLDLGKTPAQSAVLLRETARARRRSATRCCCRRRTSASSASCSAARSTTGARSRSPRSRTASMQGAGSCASTTSRGTAAASCRTIEALLVEASRRDDHLVQGADPSLARPRGAAPRRRAARRRRPSFALDDHTMASRAARAGDADADAEPDDDDARVGRLDRAPDVRRARRPRCRARRS